MPNDTPLPAIVSTEWLAARLGRPDVKIVDASWYLPDSGRDAAAEYAAGHIPGAVLYDLEASSNRSSSLPHMLPSATEFATRMSALGLDDASAIVVYDGSGLNLSAPRAWWTFRVFGHAAVAVLDGGLGKWRGEGRPLDPGTPKPKRGRFTARLDAGRVRDLAAMRANLTSGAEQVVDARAPGRFAGTAAEPRPGLRAGHIPGSLNLPFTDVVGPDGTVLPLDRLRDLFVAAGVDFARPVVASCGSGVTACCTALALELLGHDRTAVYDGSWTEWGAQSDTPIEVGPPRIDRA